jgi:hypothetical protein
MRNLVALESRKHLAKLAAQQSHVLRFPRSDFKKETPIVISQTPFTHHTSCVIVQHNIADCSKLTRSQHGGGDNGDSAVTRKYAPHLVCGRTNVLIATEPSFWFEQTRPR